MQSTPSSSAPSADIPKTFLTSRLALAVVLMLSNRYGLYLLETRRIDKNSAVFVFADPEDACADIEQELDAGKLRMNPLIVLETASMLRIEAREGIREGTHRVQWDKAVRS